MGRNLSVNYPVVCSCDYGRGSPAADSIVINI